MQVYCCEVCTLWNKIRNTAASSAMCRESIRPSYCHFDMYWMKKVSCVGKKFSFFPNFQNKNHNACKEWSAHWTVCNSLHTRMGPLLLFTLLGPTCLILGREYCFQVAFLGVVALNLPDYREEFVLELNCVFTWTGSVWSGLGFF
jgi:hypothetical protein